MAKKVLLGIWITSLLVTSGWAAGLGFIIDSDGTPTIDGVVDTIYEDAIAYDITNVVTGTVSSASDLSATYKALWDNDYLYVLVEVTDDSTFNDSTNVWDDDSIEIYIDADHTQLTTYGAKDYRYYWGWNDATISELAHSATTGVVFGSTDQTGAYIFEIKIPWSTLGVIAVGGMQIGLDVQVNDDDDGSGRDGKLTWHTLTNSSDSNPSLFGTAELYYVGSGLSKSDLVAWYDFDDATDSHGSYNLTEVGTPTYTGGYGIASETSSEQWTQATLGNNWGNVDQDTTFVCRFRGYGNFADGDYVLRANTYRHSIRHRTSGMQIEFFDDWIFPSTIASNGSWYLVVATYDATTGDMKISINDSDHTTIAGTPGLQGGSSTFGGSPGIPQDVEIDYFGCFNRKLTTAEATWLYNSGGTRTYSELGTTPFEYPSVIFDGTNDYLTRGSDLTGNADGKKGILSFWIRFPNSSDNDRILSSENEYFTVTWTSAGEIEIVGEQTSGIDALNIKTTTSYNHTDGWIHVLASWDLATTSTHLYVSDVNDKTVVTATNANIDYTRTNYVIGATPSFGYKLEAKLSEFYFNTSEYLDFSVEANRRKFISADKIPVDLGSDGSTPTGTQPIIYLHNEVPDWESNLGSGGNFIETGALVDGGADVPISSSSNAYIKDLVAWYDLDDATDSHGTYDLTELGSPTYSSGTGTASATSSAYWEQTELDDAWGNADHDMTFVCRFKGYGTFVSGDRVFASHGWRQSIRHMSGGIRGEVFDAIVNTSTVALNGSWYLVVGTYDASTGQMTVSVNDSDYTTVTQTPDLNGGALYLGGSSAAEDVEIDYFGCFNRKLRDEEITWLYNSGGTRTYADVLTAAISLADTQAPTVPTNLSSPAETDTTVDLSWTASTDNVGVTAYEVRRDTTSLGTTASTSMNITGLTPSTTYAMTVRARDAAGNWSAWSAALNVTTAADTQAPTAPTNLSSPAKTDTTVDLSWTASTDNVGVTSYDVFTDGNFAINVTGTTATITGLTASTSYAFTVKAKDAAGNVSAASSALNVTTNAASSAFAYPSVIFDGTNDYLTRGSDLTGNADGKKGILSFWIKFPNALDDDAILSSSDGYFRVEWSWTGVIEISGRQTSGSDALRINTTTSYDHMDGWIHVLASWDLATGSTHLYVSDVDDKTVVTAANANIDYTRTNYVIGANSSFGNKLEAKLSEFYFNTSEYLDFSVESNRRKFISADKIPVDLGANGSIPTGTQPIIYLHNEVPNWESNLGSGGNFTENGALVDGGADVPLATSSNAYIKDLVAWYDFDDATDSHGTYDLTPLGTPTYTGGYGIASDSSNAHWIQTSVDDAWGNADHDTTFVCRFRGYGSFVNGHYVYLSNGWKHSIRHRSDGLRAEVFDTWLNSGTTAVNGTWYLLVATYDASTGEMAVSVNDSAPVTVTATPNPSTGDLYLGGNNDARDVEIDYFGCFNRKLSAAEITWLYNSGGTRTYSEVLAEGTSDTENPSAPTNLITTGKTTTTVDLSWTASTDNVGVTGYNVYTNTGFPTAFADWDRRIQLTIAATEVGSTLTDFPVYFDLSQLPASFWANVKADGGDIRVTTSDGVTELPFEIVHIDTTAQVGEIHFKAGSISNSTDTDFYLYYDNAAASAYASTATYGSEAVWSDYGLVLNFAYMNPANIVDSSGNNTGITSTGSMSTGNAGGIEFGDNQGMTAPDNNSLDFSTAYTLYAWVDERIVDTGAFVTIAEKNWSDPKASPYASYSLGINTSDKLDCINVESSTIRYVRSSATIPTATELTMAVTYDNTTLRGYIDGVADGTKSVSGGAGNTVHSLSIGLDSDGNNDLRSRLHQLALSSQTRSADWLAARHSNHVTPNTFYSVGSEQSNYVLETNVTVTGTTATVTGLSESTSYNFVVKAKDAAGNISDPSNILSVTTNAAADTQAPTAPTNLVSTGDTATTVDLSWTASTDNVAVTGYDVYTDAVLETNVTVTGTTATVTGLSPNTSYDFTVKAKDAAGNISSVSNTANVTTAADTTAPSAPTGLSSTGNTATTVDLSWAASTDNVGVTGYDVYTDAVLETNVTVTGTTATVTGLSPNTNYSFTVKAKDAAGNVSAASSAVNVTTATDTTAPTAPTSLNSTGNTVTTVDLSWTAATDNVGVTGYDVYTNTVLETNVTITGTTATVTGLTPNTSYDFTVKAKDAAGNESAASNTANVTTVADTTAPSAPTGLNSTGDTTTTVDLSWTASTDDVAVTGYDVYTDGILETNMTILGTTAVVTNLSPLTSYSFTVKAKDAAGNVSGASNAVNVTTDADSTAPSAPSGLTSTANTVTTVDLSWTASVDNIGVTGYEVYTDGILETNVSITGTTAVVSGLSPSTSYLFTVKAKDAVGNTSSASSPLNVTTADDVTAPTAPSALSSTGSTVTTVDLSWTGSTDDVAVTGYNIYVDSVFQTNVSGPTATVTGLNPNTSYSFTVKATDAAENESAVSNAVPATTLADVTDPNAPTNVSVSSYTATSVNLSWDEATDDVAVTEYEVYTNGVLEINVSITGTTAVVTGLDPNTAYSFTVKAKDGAGNVSAASSGANATTSADTISPSTPANLNSTGKTSNTVDLSWDAATDNVAVTGYDVYRGTVLALSVSGTTATVTGLTPNTSYAFSVRAVDAAANVSNTSSPIVVTTEVHPSPDTITNLVLWLDPEVGITKDLSNKVSAWADQSINGDDAVQNTSGSQPVFVENALNGKPALSFDGTDDTLDLGQALDYERDQAITAFTVIIPDLTEDAGTVLSKMASDLRGQEYFFYGYNKPAFLVHLINSWPSNGFGVEYPSFTRRESYLLTASYDGSSAASGLSGFANGETITANAFVATGPTATIKTATSATIGSRGAYTNFFKGKIAEVIVYERELTVTERRDVENYLAIKYHLDYDFDSDGLRDNWERDHFGNLDQGASDDPDGDGVTNLQEITLGLDPNQFNVLETPQTVANLELWLDPETGITKDGSNQVSAWLDRSGQENDAVQVTSGSQPVLVENALNGKPALSFDGTNDYLDLAQALDYERDQAVTIMGVMMPDSPAQAGTVLSKMGTGDQGHDFFYQAVNLPGFRSHLINSWSSNALAVDYQISLEGAYHILTASYDGSSIASGLSGFVDGDSITQNPWITTGPTATIKTSAIASVGSRNGQNTFFKGKIVELIVYERELTSTERRDVENYLSIKYGLDYDYDSDGLTDNWERTHFGNLDQGASGDSDGDGLTNLQEFTQGLDPNQFDDLEAPSTPTGLTSPSQTSTTINLSWTASTDNVAVTDYEVYTNGFLEYNVTVTDATAVVTALNPSTTYSFMVKAKDVAGNVSSESSAINATTASADDSTAPTAPTNLASTADADTTVGLVWDASTDDVGVTSYEIYANSTLVASVSGTLTAAVVIDLTPNTSYSFTVKAKDASGKESAASNSVSVTTETQTTGSILREEWTGLSGSLVSDMTSNPNFPDNPTSSGTVTLFEGPTDVMDNYGSRIIGYLHPPTTGQYTFWIASDDKSELWLSTDSTAENRVKIAYVEVWSDSREWDKFPAQESAAITLTAGKKYFIEAIQKEATGGDNLAVAWQGPGITQAVIPGSALSLLPTDADGLSDAWELKYFGGLDQGDSGDPDGDSLTNLQEFQAGSNPAIDEDTTPKTLTGLKLWLRGDAGVEGHYNGPLTKWKDQSGQGNHATQTNGIYKLDAPIASVNGKPFVGFNGVDDYLTFSNVLSGATGGEMFVVLRTSVTSGTEQRLTNLSGRLKYPRADGDIEHDFADTGSGYVIGQPGTDITQPHLYNAVSSSGEWVARMNGRELFHSYESTFSGGSSSPSLGADISGGGPQQFFNGDVAEFIVYSRTLTDSERETIGAYLTKKYSLSIPIPPVVVGLKAAAIGSQRIALDWERKEVLGVTYKIERKVSAGSWTQIAEVVDQISYVDSGLTAATSYEYRVTARTYGGEAAVSDVVSATTLPISYADIPSSGMQLWYSPETLSLGSNGLNIWRDLSGQDNHAVQETMANRPDAPTTTFNGKPVVSFDGTDDNFLIPHVLNGATAGEIFVVLRATSASGTERRLTNVSGILKYPMSDGQLAHNFGSTTNYVLGQPLMDITQPRVYHALSTNGQWEAHLDGDELHATTTNTFAANAPYWTGKIYLGADASEDYGYAGTWFAGDVAEVMIYNRILNTSERRSLDRYFAAKYGLDIYPYNVASQDPTGDLDGDGISNSDEVDLYGTDPTLVDSDEDGMPDAWEILWGFDPVVDDASSDLDSDGVSNLKEFLQQRNPTKGAIPDDGSHVDLQIYSPKSQ